MSKNITPENPRIPERLTREWELRVQIEILTNGRVEMPQVDTSFTPINPHPVDYEPIEEARIVGEARKNCPLTKPGT